MAFEEYFERADAYLEENWEALLADMDALVSIPSLEDLEAAAPNAPYGPGPARALETVLDIAERMGFSTCNENGYIGYCDWPGSTPTQLGIIGHVDVVPAGPGWTFEPFALTRHDGFLVGRGTADDKGPSIIVLWALKFWKDQGVTFPYSLRFLFGANEETGMRDVEYYRARHSDPAFLFTPDAEFPVCFGEKGLFGAVFTSAPITYGRIEHINAGAAPNAVPGAATAVIAAGNAAAANPGDASCANDFATAEEADTAFARLNTATCATDLAAMLPAAEGIAVSVIDDTRIRIDAQGKSAHASTPDLGESALLKLVNYLLDNGLCSADERRFLEFDQQLLASTDGSSVGIAASDEFFGSLTGVGGMLNLDEQGRFVQTYDVRFPTSADPAAMEQALAQLAQAISASYRIVRNEQPFLIKPDTPAICALLDAYNQVTGEGTKPFTMGGATYAREFTSAASFGMEKPWVPVPSWVGSMHGANEAISEDAVREAFKIYVTVIQKLMNIQL